MQLIVIAVRSCRTNSRLESVERELTTMTGDVWFNNKMFVTNNRLGLVEKKIGNISGDDWWNGRIDSTNTRIGAAENLVQYLDFKLNEALA